MVMTTVYLVMTMDQSPQITTSVATANKRRQYGVVNGCVWATICSIDGWYYCKNWKVSSITWWYV